MLSVRQIIIVLFIAPTVSFSKRYISTLRIQRIHLNVVSLKRQHYSICMAPTNQHPWKLVLIVRQSPMISGLLQCQQHYRCHYYMKKLDFQHRRKIIFLIRPWQMPSAKYHKTKWKTENCFVMRHDVRVFFGLLRWNVFYNQNINWWTTPFRCTNIRILSNWNFHTKSTIANL